MLQDITQSCIITDGTATITKTWYGGGIVLYTIDWLSSALGQAVILLPKIDGYIARLVFNPDGGGTQPDDQHDIVINDLDSLDVSAGKGTNLSNTTTTSVSVFTTDGTFASRYCVCGTLTVSISGAGELNGGIIRIYIEQVQGFQV